MQTLRTHRICVTSLFLLSALPIVGQGTLADYQRGHDLRTRARDLVIDTPGAMTWIGDTHHFWYSKSVPGGTAFVLADADAGTKKPAFDSDRLAAATSSVAGKSYTGLKLPFAPVTGRPGARPTGNTPPTTAPLTFVDNERSIQFGIDGLMYKCDLSEYKCSKVGPIPRPEREGRPAASEDAALASPSLEGDGGDPQDGLEFHPPAPQAGDAGSYSNRPRACAPSRTQQERTQARAGRGGDVSAAEPADVCLSFDGKYEAYVQNFNVFLKLVVGGAGFPLSFDGSEGNYYTLRSFAWSPDSKKLVAYHTRPGYDREVMYIESSPVDQVQPKHRTEHYVKPGDPVDLAFRHCSMWRRNRRQRSTRDFSQTLMRSARQCGGRIIADSRLSTTSEATRLTR